MDSKPTKRYLRFENVVFIEMLEGETQEEAEDRFMDALPDGVDIVSFKSQYWEPDK